MQCSFFFLHQFGSESFFFPGTSGSKVFFLQNTSSWNVNNFTRVDHRFHWSWQCLLLTRLFFGFFFQNKIETVCLTRATDNTVYQNLKSEIQNVWISIKCTTPYCQVSHCFTFILTFALMYLYRVKVYLQDRLLWLILMWVIDKKGEKLMQIWCDAFKKISLKFWSSEKPYFFCF